MTCDGKVMSVTERECGGIQLANGGDPDNDELAKWNIGVAWLGMTYETAVRWCNGFEDEPHDGPYAKTIERDKARERKRWYA
jgi:hypothetical protein